MIRVDAVIIGGSFSGAAAALYLARARRTVIVFDEGQPRNRFSSEGHGFLGMDGLAPADIQARAQGDLEKYSHIEVRRQRALHVSGQFGDFRIVSEDGGVTSAARVILAHGMIDRVPEIPGLSECWGKTALPCPYCHGYEVADLPTGVIVTHAGSLHQARLLGDWTDDLSIILHGTAIAPEDRSDLERRKARIVDDAVVSVEHEDGAISSVTLRKGGIWPVSIVYVVAQASFATAFPTDLGCETEVGPFGPIVKVDAQCQTTVRGVFAAGDITRPVFGATWAAADGMSAGVACHQSLVLEP